MSTAREIVSRVCNEHRNSDLRADNKAVLSAIDAELAAKNGQIADLEFQLSALKELDKSKSPCGHFASYAYSEDGKGKVIVCLLCEYLERADVRRKIAEEILHLHRCFEGAKNQHEFETTVRKRYVQDKPASVSE